MATRLDDQRLEKLIRMAVEIEEIETAGTAGAAAATTAPVFSPRETALRRAHMRRRGWGRIASLAATAAAACITVAWYWGAPVEPVIAPRPLPMARNFNDSAPEVTVSQPAVGDSYVLLAIFRSADGKCQCRSWRVDRLAPGKTIAQLETGELVDAALRGRCVQEIEGVQVMAVGGRADQLPVRHEQVEPLLECFEKARPQGGAEAALADSVAGSSCVPGSLMVRTQYVSVAKR